MKRFVFFGVWGLLVLLGLTWGRATAVAPAGQWFARWTADMGVEQRISMISGSDGWLLQFNANSNMAYLARYDGSRWNVPVNGSVAHSQTIGAADLEMVSTNDGWLVLGGWLGSTSATSSIYRWDGSNWNFVTQLTDPNDISLSSLKVLAANDVWALGGGKFWSNLYHWDGSSWSFAGKTPGGVWVDRMDMLSANDGWAVGMNGKIAHWNGNNWTEVSSATTTTLNDINMIDANTGWAVGDNGAIQKWNGTSWSTYSSPTSANLYSIDMVSENEGWIMGSGIMLYWDGVQWNQYTPSTNDWFNDVDMISANSGWAIGNNSVQEYEIVRPELLMQYTSGAPGSYFSVAGNNFPANSTATISVNGRTLGTTPVDGNGSFLFLLTTASADEGTYYVTASVNPSATTQFVLNAAEPVRPQEDTGDMFDVPAGIAFTEFVYLPTIIR